MKNPIRSPKPRAMPEPPRADASAPDPADLGTAYGLEMSIDSCAKPTAVDIDLNDPLSWIRRWVDRQHPSEP